jgi:hypothetical protein
MTWSLDFLADDCTHINSHEISTDLQVVSRKR